MHEEYVRNVRTYKISLKQTNEFPSKYSNGLYKDVNYYGPLKQQGQSTDYVVALSDTTISQLYYSDWATLNDGEWVSNFVIDIIFHLMNEQHSAKVELISCENCYYVFSRPKTDYSLQLDFTKPVVFPVLIGENHWCLAMADFAERKCVWLNPFGNVFEIKKIF